MKCENLFASPTLSGHPRCTHSNEHTKETNQQETHYGSNAQNKQKNKTKKNSTNIRTEYEVMATDRDYQEVKRPSLQRHNNAPTAQNGTSRNQKGGI
jgi:hypothetical protein